MVEPIVIAPDANGATPAPPVTGSFTQAQVDSAAASARREASDKASELQKRLDVLEAQEEERKNATLSEVEKAKKEAENYKAQIEELSPYKIRLEEYETQQADKFNEVMKEAEFTDAQIARVNKLPLGDRSDMIADLKNASQLTPPDNAGKPNSFQSDPTKANILAMPDGPDKITAWKKYKASIGQ